MTNVALYKHQAKSVSDLKSEISFKTREIQEACLVGSSSICRKCSTGKLENGLYVPTDTNAVKMLLLTTVLADVVVVAVVAMVDRGRYLLVISSTIA